MTRSNDEWPFRLTTYLLWSWGTLWPQSYLRTATDIDDDRTTLGIPSIFG